jgi:hypothetical protein
MTIEKIPAIAHQRVEVFSREGVAMRCSAAADDAIDQPKNAPEQRVKLGLRSTRAAGVVAACEARERIGTALTPDQLGSSIFTIDGDRHGL